MKKQGFQGQRAVVLPQRLLNILQNNILSKDLYLSDVGYYPNAINHYAQRPDGAKQNILILCTSGSGWIEVNGEKSVLEENTYYIIPKNESHRYAASSIKPWTIYWIHFTGEKDEVFSSIYGKVLSVDGSRFARKEERIELFEELLVVLEEDITLNNLEYSSILLTHILGSLKYIEQFRKIKEVTQKDSVSKAIQYMKENINTKLTLEQISLDSGLSLSHFSLKFKKQTSQSPIDYFTMLKMQKACELIVFTRLKIKELALQLGFDDPYYFSRIFSKTMGISPKEYRKREQLGYGL